MLTNIIHGLLGKSSSPRLWLQSFAPRNIRQAALEKLKSVGLEEFAGRSAEQLSGGQSQRVAIARALMQNPRIIFADEPTASLDPQAGHDVMELLHKLCKEEGITLVYTTHDLEHAEKYSDQIVALKVGEVVIKAATASINFAELESLYVD